jgi:hypothetical protein
MNGVQGVAISDFANEQQNSNAALFGCGNRFPNGPLEELTLYRQVPCPPRALYMVFFTI